MQITDFKSFVQVFTDLGLKLIPLLGVIAFLIFIIGVGRFIRTNSESKESDKGMLIWGVIGLFVLFTIWGIIKFIQGEFFPNTAFGIPIINLKGSNGWAEGHIVPDNTQ